MEGFVGSWYEISCVFVIHLSHTIRAFFFVFGKQRHFYNIVTFFEIERTADFGFYFIDFGLALSFYADGIGVAAAFNCTDGVSEGFRFVWRR